jgi:acetoin:2,6-dichlorophenolindophenol oxidoreductase subunit beta
VAMTALTYGQAVSRGLADAMDADPRVFLMGEDVAEGGAYGGTQGLTEQFGRERVRNTPLSENAIVGYGLGAAVAGLRPVVEIMHMDFITCAMDQVVNQVAKLRYMFGAKATVPLVIRTPTGGWLNAAAQHSQSLEAWFCHTPGLKVATAGTPADIRALLISAVADDNPVVVLEPLCLYEQLGEVPDRPDAVPLGRASFKHRGDDVTVITWGAMVPRVMTATAALAEQGIQVDMIDLISLVPWDVEAVIESVRRTNRAVVVHQASRRAGFGAEVSATIIEQAFDYLDAPVARVCALDVPVPFSTPLEQYVLPDEDRVISAVRRIVQA